MMRIGTQARSFGEGVYQDHQQFLTVMEQIGRVGFEGMETNWLNIKQYFQAPERFIELLDDAGIALIGAHYGGALWDDAAMPDIEADIRRVAEFVKAVGGEAIVFSCRPPEEDSVDAWKLVGRRFNELGQVCLGAGVRLACHNHWWELDGIGLRTVADEADSGLVDFAFDTGHCVRAGDDPAAWIRELGERISIIHLADWDGETRPQLGLGDLDVYAVRDALADIGYDGWLALEEETHFGEALDQVVAAMAVARLVAG